MATSGTYAFNPALGDIVLNARVHDLLLYDPATGRFTRRVGVRGAAAGSIAGSLCKNGHVYIGVDRRKYLASRLAWLYVTGSWPSNEIDHENRDPSDNRWSNLRCATRPQNEANKAAYSNNKSGFKGVSWNRQRQKWRAQICINGKNKLIGQFDRADDAHAAYAYIATQARGEFARV